MAATGTGIRRAAVLGSPIHHSLSPALYRAAFAELGLTHWSFDALECTAAELPDRLRRSGTDWAGFAVTMPGKAAAAAAADLRSPRVARMGVANTLVRGEHGWRAENTDVDGVIGALHAARVEPGGPVLLLGGGGTARAVVVALAELSWDGPLLLAGRRPASTAGAIDLAHDLGLAATACDIEAGTIGALADRLALAVSTIPAGAADHLADALAAIPAILDVIYDPWPTRLAAAGQPGRTTITGLDMLLHQGLRQFELITGHAAPARRMRTALRAATGSDLPLPI